MECCGAGCQPARRLAIGASLRVLATRAQDGILAYIETEPITRCEWISGGNRSLWSSDKSRLVASMRHMGSSAGRVLSKTNSHGLSVNLFAQGIEQVAREQTLDILEQLVFLTADMCSKQGGEFEQQRR
jgi:hypothetical protein